MRDFVKIYATILDSSVWGESKDVKLLWVTMLAMGGEKGVVEASVGGLARRAGLTREECEVALETLSAPDPDDRSGVNEGRRIQKTEGGWLITNHKTYRDFRTDAQVGNAERQQRFRDNNPKPKVAKPAPPLVPVTTVTNNDVTPNNAPSRADRERDQDQERKPEIARAREAAPAPPPVHADHQEPVKTPRNPAEALAMPITERAAFTEQNAHMAQWLTPEAWPEVRAVAQAVHQANGMAGDARLLPYAKDSGVRAVVALFAAGFPLDELLAAVRGVTRSKWWRSDEGKPRSLGALSVEVIRREQAGARETQLSPEQLRRIARAKQGLGPDPRRAGATAPSLLATVLPTLAAGGES